MKKPKPRDVVCVRFYDHASQASIVECEAIGRVKSIDDLSIEIYTWKLESDDKDFCNNNDEYYSIVLSTVIELTILS